MKNGDKVIELSGIYKRFGTAQVLTDVNFELRKGEIHGLVGENGAGKSTLMNILFGLVKYDLGNVIVKDKLINNVTTSAIKQSGVALIPQKLQTAPNLSVAENLFIGIWPQHKYSKLVNWKMMYDQAAELLDKVNLSIDPKQSMGSLSYVDQQMVVISKMLFAEQADIVLLDEPTAPLVQQEVDLLFEFILSLQREGYSFIYVSHFLNEVFDLCNRVTVLRDGKVVFTKHTKELTMSELITGMVGEDVELYPKRDAEIGENLFEVKNLTVNPLINNLDISLRQGEILGIAGRKGSGRTELARAICGLDVKESGDLYLKGEKIIIKQVQDGLNQGIGYLTEDRIRWGLVGCRSLKENATITFINKLANHFGLIKINQENEIVKGFIETYDIRTTGPNQSAKNLSGGNQQKVVIAKLLGSNLKVLFLDDPTFGVDVKAKTHVYRIMNNFVERGNSIILISSDIYELIEMCDRIHILENGNFNRSFNRGEITEKQLQEVLTHGFNG